MDEAHMVEIIMAVVAFLAAAGWAQTNYRINHKVNCDLCKEKEKRAGEKFSYVDSQLLSFKEQMKVYSLSKSNTDTQIELVKMSTCLDKLYKEIKVIKEA